MGSKATTTPPSDAKRPVSPPPPPPPRASDCYPEGHPIRQIVSDLEVMSGIVLWRVKASWANKGRLGEFDQIVAAHNAIEAIRIAWEPEDERDLRTVEVEWLCPVESVVRKE